MRGDNLGIVAGTGVHHAIVGTGVLSDLLDLGDELGVHGNGVLVHPAVDLDLHTMLGSDAGHIGLDLLGEADERVLVGVTAVHGEHGIAGNDVDGVGGNLNMTEGEYQRIALGISLGDGLGHNLGEGLDHVVAIAHTSGAGVIGLAVQADVVATLAGDGGDDAHLLAFHLEGVALLDVELQECLDVVERTRVGGANAISIFAPCHRVIGSNHSLVGYGGGLPAKKRLLDLELNGKPLL